MKFSKRLIGVLVFLAAVVVLAACGTKNEAPTITGANPITIDFGSVFEPLADVKGQDKEDGELDVVVVSNNVDTSVPGTYQVKYSVTDSKGVKTEVTRTVTVKASEVAQAATYLSGVDYSKLPGSEKGKLFAAAERHLLENVYAGIPLYSGATRVMYSDRTQLFSPTYNGVLGFGTAFSQFSKDDSNVLMYGSTFGNAGEYTWRSSFNTNPTTLNPWISDDSNSSDFIDLFSGGIFDFYFDETKAGYEILPSLAAAEPVPLNPQTINGKTYSKVWQIQLRDDLEWKFHPNTDTSALPEGFEKLDATDYLWTWKLAMEKGWLRAKSGGGDFIDKGVKGAADFIAGTGSWENVGLKIVNGNTIEIEYIDLQGTFDVKYGFAGGILTPLNKELYEHLGEANYGQGPTSVASSGIYYFDVYTPDQLLTFKKNTLHPDSEMYHFTGQQYRYIQDQQLLFAEFEAGRLESASVPATKANEYADDPRVKVAPDATTTRLSINSFGTPEARDAFMAAHPNIKLDDSYVPEPILGYVEMRQAMYYGLDRQTAAVDIGKNYLPAFTYFTSLYFLDAESGTSVRGFAEGQQIVEDFGGGTNAFVPDAAKDLFRAAVEKGIADGHYQKGTASSYTVIELSLVYASSGNTSFEALIANVIEQYEARLVDDVNFVKVDILEQNVEFPNNYYDYLMPAKVDLGVGGIQGSLLDAPGFLDVFSDDNRGGFTLNWGIDTSTANIEVEYVNLAGVQVKELWSFNAIVAALSKKTYVKDGVEQKDWATADSLIQAYVDMGGKEVESIEDDVDNVAEAVIGELLADIATEEGFDSLVSKIVTTKDGNVSVYVISKTGTKFELYNSYGLYTSAEAAIKPEVIGAGASSLDAAVLLATDAEVAADEYLAEEVGLTTLAAIAEELEVSLEQMQVYAITYTYSGTQSSDAYVLLKVGDFYIPVVWL